MAKKSATKKSATKKSANSTKKRSKVACEEEIVLAPEQDQALKLVDKSVKIRTELEDVVTLAASKAVRKLMKEHGIALTAPQAEELTSIWFSE
jgi:murein tripeptide amidase MpaA